MPAAALRSGLPIHARAGDAVAGGGAFGAPRQLRPVALNLDSTVAIVNLATPLLWQRLSLVASQDEVCDLGAVEEAAVSYFRFASISCYSE